MMERCLPWLIITCFESLGNIPISTRKLLVRDILGACSDSFMKTYIMSTHLKSSIEAVHSKYNYFIGVQNASLNYLHLPLNLA